MEIQHVLIRGGKKEVEFTFVLINYSIIKRKVLKIFGSDLKTRFQFNVTLQDSFFLSGLKNNNDHENPI